MANLQLFTTLMNAFDQEVAQTISSGSANVVTLVSPLMLSCFSLYLLLIALTYWNGATEVPVGDTIKRLLAWGAILTFGLNINMYTGYVVPFFNGLGDDIAQALLGSKQSGQVLDTLLNGYINAIAKMWGEIPSGLDAIGPFFEALFLTMIVVVGGSVFLGIAAAYIILAHFALAILLALGPLFIGCAMFPATRQYFDNWVGQCMNYAFLTVLFAAAAAIEVRFATDAMPGSGSALAQSLYGGNALAASGLGMVSALGLAAMFVVFIIVGLNLPGLASQLAGGVGISSMTGKLGALRGGGRGQDKDKGKDKKSGGSMAPEAG